MFCIESTCLCNKTHSGILAERARSRQATKTCFQSLQFLRDILEHHEFMHRRDPYFFLESLPRENGIGTNIHGEKQDAQRDTGYAMAKRR